jgi:hypothetical protein
MLPREPSFVILVSCIKTGIAGAPAPAAQPRHGARRGSGLARATRVIAGPARGPSVVCGALDEAAPRRRGPERLGPMRFGFGD